MPGRIDAHGQEVQALDVEALASAIERLRGEDVDSFAVCFLHAYANDAHEQAARRILEELAPNAAVSLSSEVLPEIKEYERTSTTVINAYVQPVVDRYGEAMQRDVATLGMTTPIMVMQSNGGMMPLDGARRLPMHIIESGPAAGVTGAFHLARQMELSDVMTLDMGGTTAKAAIIEDGVICRSPEYEVGGEISIGHRLMKGSGYLLRVPSIDLAEVGAGGGSIAWTDSAGALKVGPRSASASPGPACYGLGGTEPTITDANVYLGLTNPESLAGGTLTISPGLAEDAIREHIATPLGLDLVAAAEGIRAVASSSLIRALRAVSTERGRDPRDFVLFAFGGMGPVHALDVAEDLGIDTVVVPPFPGLFSALGLLSADVEHHLVKTLYADTTPGSIAPINEAIETLIRSVTDTLDGEGYPASRREVSIALETRYAGQDSSLPVDIQRPTLDHAALEQLVRDFHGVHEKNYGYRSEAEAVQVVAIRCVGRGISHHSRVPEQLSAALAPQRRHSAARKCYFGREHEWLETPVLGREDTSANPHPGPALIEEDDSLTVVLPGWQVSKDARANLILTRLPAD